MYKLLFSNRSPRNSFEVQATKQIQTMTSQLSPELCFLKDDHRIIYQQLDDFNQGNLSVMPHVIKHICSTLALEEAVICPIVKRVSHDQGEHILNELLKNHFPIYRICQHLLDSDSNDSELYQGLARQLDEKVRDHFTKTEETALPELDRLLNQDQKQLFVRAYMDAKKIAPHAPVALVRHLWLVGHDAAAYEQLRDSVQQHHERLTNNRSSSKSQS